MTFKNFMDLRGEVKVSVSERTLKLPLNTRQDVKDMLEELRKDFAYNHSLISESASLRLNDQVIGTMRFYPYDTYDCKDWIVTTWDNEDPETVPVMIDFSWGTDYPFVQMICYYWNGQFRVAYKELDLNLRTY